MDKFMINSVNFTVNLFSSKNRHYQRVIVWLSI